MRMRILLSFVISLGVIVLVVVYGKALSFDGQNPPHAVTTDGKAIPESSTTQPDKPIILSKDIPKDDPKYGEMKPEAAFDHSKHNTDPRHTMDGKTMTACVYCHHTDQPSAPGKPYLKRFEANWKEPLTAEALERTKEPVKSCRVCHWQKKTTATNEFPPKSVKYPKELVKLIGDTESGELNNENAYHIRCVTCHNVAMDDVSRNPKAKAPTGCPDCHIKK